MVEISNGCRSIPLGVKITKGFLYLAFNCLLKTWNKLAGVVQLTTNILPSAHSCKNLSNRAEECSAPWPSEPCGKYITKPFLIFHLSSTAQLHCSMMICPH